MRPLMQLPKEAHESPMLSLDKTKDREALREFVGEHPDASFLETGSSLQWFLPMKTENL